MTFSPTWNSTRTSLSSLTDELGWVSEIARFGAEKDIVANAERRSKRQGSRILLELRERRDAPIDVRLVVVEVRRDADPLGLFRHEHLNRGFIMVED